MRDVFKVAELDHQFIGALLQTGGDVNRREIVVMAKSSQLLAV